MLIDDTYFLSIHALSDSLFSFSFYLVTPVGSLLLSFQVGKRDSAMASSTRQDWSDEEEDLIRTETSVFLGIPDGPVEVSSDLNDAAVSRIGGLPVRFIPNQP